MINFNRTILLSLALTIFGFGPLVSRAAPLDNSQWINQEVQTIQSQGCTADPNVLRLALTAFLKAEQQGYVNKKVLTLIDYSKPSTEKRMWVIDLNSGKTLINTWVAHGKNSGDLNATSFSNTEKSLKTSIGVFVTDQTYQGKHGLSLHLRGLEPGFNDNAYKRSVVVHAAPYVSADVIKEKGRLGRSWGCPAVNPSVAPTLINTIKDKTVLFSYYPDQNWLSHSQFI